MTVPWLSEVVLDFLEVQGLKEACQAVREAGKRVVVAMPRILKPDEQRLSMFYLRLNADSLLLRGSGGLQQFLDLGGTGALGRAVQAVDFVLNYSIVALVDIWYFRTV